MALATHDLLVGIVAALARGWCLDRLAVQYASAGLCSTSPSTANYADVILSSCMSPMTRWAPVSWLEPL
jgi:hypothetical protein